MRPRAWRSGAIAVAISLATPAPALSEPVGSPETTIRKTLTRWTDAFNARRTNEVCGLFARDLRYDYRGFPERGFEDVCALLQRSLADPSKRYTYDLQINEVMVSGDMAAVRLVWTLTIKGRGDPEGVATKEPGLDIFRRQFDGTWKIVRYLAFED